MGGCSLRRGGRSRARIGVAGGLTCLLTELRRRLKARGGSMFFGTRATVLRMSGSRCGGVTAQSRGAQVAFDADAVVVADGGFPASPELFREFIGPRPDLVLQRNAGTATGDGLRMAQQVGAAVIGLDRFLRAFTEPQRDAQ